MKYIFQLIATGCCVCIVSTLAIANTSDHSNIQSKLITDGIALYAEYCASCHQSFDETTKPRRSFARLQSSIKYLPSMNSLESITDQQLETIVAALTSLPTK